VLKSKAVDLLEQNMYLALKEGKETAFEMIFKTFYKPLYRMVRNSCLNVIKHEKVKKQHVAHEMAMGESSHESVSQAVVSSELEKRIYDAMKTLPEQCRLVFQLSRFEELKYAEIADQLNISVKTVENHMGKALKLMRGHLKEYLPLFLIFMKDWM